MDATVQNKSGMSPFMVGFLGLWFVLNVLQSYFTELFNDEALYWAFAQRPDLGYFDHPPMTAWVIALFDWIPGEIGVRLPFVLMSTGTIFFLWKLVRPRDEKLFVALIFGMVIMHIGGFFAAPDVPLVFFVTLFLYLYKTYFYRDDWKYAIYLGLVLAAMGWAKYHAILFAVALVLSNVTLLRRKSFYLMVGIALLSVLPHLWWQYAHDWVTFDFHLNNRRGQKPWHWGWVGEYIGGQFLLFGPLLSLLLFPAVVKFKQRDHYDCVMKYTFFIVMGFFFISTFKGRVEANWTAMVAPAVIYLGYLYMEERPRWRKWALIFSGISAVALLALRLILAFEILPPSMNPRNETHGQREWAHKVGALANGRPVLFINSYQKPAKYAFYQGGETYDWNMAKYSGNQYDLWIEDELALQGKEVIVMSNDIYSLDSMVFGHGMHSDRYKVIKDFRSYNFIEIRASGVPREGRADDIVDDVVLTVYNPTDRTVSFDQTIQLQAIYFQYEKALGTNILSQGLPFDHLDSGEERSFHVALNLPEKPGAYQMKLALYYYELPGLNSRPYPIQVH